jgi:transposase
VLAAASWITDEHLREVARIYSNDTTGAPTKAVADHFNTSRQNAGKWVKAAREQGLMKERQR